VCVWGGLKVRMVFVVWGIGPDDDIVPALSEGVSSLWQLWGL
jgi:hypothetical protein